ncbi:cupin-like domain-containing protein [Sphingorhabdus sp.]|uniref:cupin-like domain-containing protein n=1 Tax=Sphingorhabdus sp. TaxID=1902408 RepID=UPI0039199840
MTAIFDSSARQHFVSNYPETPHRLLHQLRDHPLLTVEALATLAESLPAASVEYNKGDLPLGIDPALVSANGLTFGDTIRHADSSGSWAVLKNIQQKAEYNALLMGLLAELKPHIEKQTGRMLKPQAFVFVSSPHAVTPYHFDPEHNILMQLRGTKVMTQFPAGDTRFAPDETHEGYHRGGHRNLLWHDSYAGGGTEWTLEPGQAVYVPVMAPHHVCNGPETSLSLSITWRSDWSFAEADARAFNSLLRKMGCSPKAPGRFPHQNRAKAVAWRIMRKLRLA